MAPRVPPHDKHPGLHVVALSIDNTVVRPLVEQGLAMLGLKLDDLRIRFD